MVALSLYIHIPFCTRKCDYCHFYVIPNSPRFHALYMEGLQAEMQIPSHHIESIYFGGGTPSLLGPKQLETILSWIPGWDHTTEITLEANPENLTEEDIIAYKQIGINRLSIGVQSLNPSELTLLTRTHTAPRAIEAIKTASKAGFTNISIDLMFDLPNQPLALFENSLQKALKLPISHLSLYNLTIEPHTVFHKKKLPSADPAISCEMYQMAQKTLSRAGFEQYEISAFAKEGQISRHNTGYWTARPFLGFGPSAYSFFEGKRYRNIANIHRWHDAVCSGKSSIDYSEQLEPNALKRELLVIGLRMLRGVDYTPFEEETDRVVHRLIEEGFLIKNPLRLTQKGILFYDTVAAELI